MFRTVGSRALTTAKGQDRIANIDTRAIGDDDQHARKHADRTGTVGMEDAYKPFLEQISEGGTILALRGET